MEECIIKYKDSFYLKTEVGYKKIILTTDQDLDGVQAIDDEFLEWFVKNSSCKEVEVENICNNCGDINCIHAICRSQVAKTKGDTYKIIIPKEEPKQERMISKEAYEDVLNMQKCSNAGYESKISELQEEIKKLKKLEG